MKKIFKKRIFKKRWIRVISVVLILWFAIGLIDCVRVTDYKRPIFCIYTNSADDGGSGKYIGLGYSFDIVGKFLPEDKEPAVTEYTFYIFGLKVNHRESEN